MRTIIRRVHRLEERFTPRENEHARRMLHAMREARRRYLAALGNEPEPEQPRRREDYYDANGRPLSLAEVMRNARSCKRQQDLERAGSQENPAAPPEDRKR